MEIPVDADPGIVHNNLSGKITFEFDGIFCQEASQDEIYETVVKSKVLDSINGINSTIFAYGQTGSGELLHLYIFLFSAYIVYTFT